MLSSHVLYLNFNFLQNGSGEVSESASTSSLGSNSSHSKAPGAQLSHSKLQYSQISALDLSKQLMAIDSDNLLNSMEKDQRKQALYMAYSGLGGTITQSIVSPYFNAGDY